MTGGSRREALTMCLALHEWHDEQIKTLKAAKFDKSVLADVVPAVARTVRTGRGPAMPVVIGGTQEHREQNPLFSFPYHLAAARKVKRAEVERVPAAKAAVDGEVQKLA